MKQIAERLDSARIQYMLTGSMAMAIYSVPRMTRGIDWIIECQPEDAPRITALFKADCHVDVESVKDAAIRRSMFNIIHNEWIIKADFIVRGEDEYRRVEFARKRQFDIEGAPIWVATPEDLILSKLKWGQDSESELQRRDVQTLIESSVDLDWDYIRKWAEHLCVRNLLDQVAHR